MGKKGLNLNSVSRTEAIEGDTDYMIVEPGLNYLGFCKGEKCVASNKSVVCRRGHGSHMVNEDVTHDKVLCPKCHLPFEVAEIALYRCKAKVTIHDHQSTTDAYECKGKEVVKLGARGELKDGNSNAKKVSSRNSADCLLEITTKPLQEDKCTIC
uniref:Uncharacterized protein n=1 Tax=Eutreptiella gymnastica TaxID=73025 RepID=A0A7S1J3Y5_9EUGL|mmetsp:Transcript_65320/g.116181  ORF Transcript_65320/g.116181 Transcript_65320/m.116181 type:complete len:155 (+) Transcript_65320:60-524(+)